MGSRTTATARLVIAVPFLLIRFLLDVPASRCLVDSRRQHTAEGAYVAEILLPTEMRREFLANSITKRRCHQLQQFAIALQCSSRQSCNPPEKPMCRSDLEESGKCDWRRPPPAGYAPSLSSADGRCFSMSDFLSFASSDSKTLPIIALVCCLQEARNRETQIMAGRPAGTPMSDAFHLKGLKRIFSKVFDQSHTCEGHASSSIWYE